MMKTGTTTWTESGLYRLGTQNPLTAHTLGHFDGFERTDLVRQLISLLPGGGVAIMPPPRQRSPS
ncbi:MAG: hypothetical protein GY719_43120 [bacterium]|nr:hypothetical protein [bacterium]